MLWTIIQTIISMLIMYKCCEKFEYKITWLIYTGINTLIDILTGSFSVLALLINAMVAALAVAIYYKIYERCNQSFGKFLAYAFLLQLGIALILIVIASISAMLITSNGILAG